MHEFVEHYHHERNHQGLDNELIDGHSLRVSAGRIRRRQRLGGLLKATITEPPDGSRPQLGRVVGHFYEAALSSYPVGRSSTGSL
jgi:hypothetical protein